VGYLAPSYGYEGQKDGIWAMSSSTREPFITYLLDHARLLRSTGAPTMAADQLAEHARALELVADVVRELAEDDERLLVLSTLAVRGGQFLPGPCAEHALNHFTSTSVQACDAFLWLLCRVARDDSLARAREHGFLPPQRSR
jgi:hypothetical protein